MSLGYAKAATDGAYRTKNEKSPIPTGVDDDLYFENDKRIEPPVDVGVLLFCIRKQC